MNDSTKQLKRAKILLNISKIKATTIPSRRSVFMTSLKPVSSAIIVPASPSRTSRKKEGKSPLIELSKKKNSERFSLNSNTFNI